MIESAFDSYHLTPESRGPDPQEIDRCSLDLNHTVSDSSQKIEEDTVGGPAAGDEDNFLLQGYTLERSEAEKDTGTQTLRESVETQTLNERNERQDSIAESSNRAELPQRLKKVPMRLTYGVLGNQKSVAVSSHVVSFVQGAATRRTPYLFLL